MAKDTPSMAKNKIRRSLAAILDPHPSAKEVERLWAYFGSSCAYCGLELLRESRIGHLDHVSASAFGGSNSIHNHVLSCARCNGDEKREMCWEEFLKVKCPETSAAQERHARISNWLAVAPVKSQRAVAQEFENIVAAAIANYEGSVAQVRELRKRGT